MRKLFFLGAFALAIGILNFVGVPDPANAQDIMLASTGIGLAGAGLGGMIIDSRLEFSDAQALTATAVSTNIIDLSSDRDVGVGEPLWLVISCDVALAGTSPTLDIDLQTDSAAGMSSPTVIMSSVQKTAMAAGDKIVLAVPNANEQFLRVNYTIGGTTPTVTLSAWLTDQEPTSWTAQPDAI